VSSPNFAHAFDRDAIVAWVNREVVADDLLGRRHPRPRPACLDPDHPQTARRHRSVGATATATSTGIATAVGMAAPPSTSSGAGRHTASVTREVDPAVTAEAHAASDGRVVVRPGCRPRGA
jgi:hypothetical protein